MWTGISNIHGTFRIPRYLGYLAWKVCNNFSIFPSLLLF
ncbi:mCG148230 [Mus musculus]|nr:mCG148230 [Mus musculus]